MFDLRLENPVTSQVHTLGPVPYVKFVGGSLRVGPDDREVASYRDGTWHVDGDGFLSIAVGQPVTVRFEEPDNGSCAAPLGPFDHVKVVDGAIRQGPRLGRLVARLDEDAQSWYVYSDRKNCPAAVLEPS